MSGLAKSEDEDEELYVFSQYAPAPVRMATQPLSLIPAATLEGRAASPAPLTTAGVSGGRATPPTVVSRNVGFGPAEFEGSGFPTAHASVLRDSIVFSTKMFKMVRCRLRKGRRLAKLYLRLC